MRIKTIVAVLTVSLMSGCQNLSQTETEVIRPLIPAVSCWKYHIKSDSPSPDQIREATARELRKIYSSIRTGTETETQAQAREKILLVWARKYRLSDEARKQIQGKVNQPGTCELNLFSEK